MALAANIAAQTTLPPAPNDFIADVIQNVSDSAVAYTIRGLEAFGSRSWSNANRDNVAAWILRQYQEAGVSDVALDSFQYGGTWQKNVVATIPGTTSADKEIIVGGHYDSVNGSPGADDNASGTAAAIEMARVLRAVGYTPRATLRFMAFPAEEAGLLGSANYASRAKTANRKIVLMQNYDMIGYRDTTRPDRQVYIVWYSNSLTEARLDSTLKRTYTTLTPVLTTSYSGSSDSYSFYNQGYKTVFNIERNFSPFYHSYQDSSTKLDFGFAAEIIKSGLALLLTTDASVSSVEGPLAQGPTAYALEQNYPNPFNSSSDIGFRIEEVGHVTLEVYDMLGRGVTTLVNEEKSAGSYAVRFDASGLASGVYFYRLSVSPLATRALVSTEGRDRQAGAFSATRRLLLLK